MHNKPATHLFHAPVQAQYIRIRPKQWVGSISLRLELLGSLGKTRVVIIVGFFYFCQYLHIGAGILSFGGDVFRL